MESHKFIVVPLFCKMAYMKKRKKHGDVPDHHKMDDYIFRGSNSTSSIFTLFSSLGSIKRANSML